MALEIIPKTEIVHLIGFLLSEMRSMLQVDNKKNEIDELAENVFILLTKEIIDADLFDDVSVGKFTVEEFVDLISSAKPKNFKSLTNKAIFKFMDISELFT